MEGCYVAQRRQEDQDDEDLESIGSCSCPYYHSLQARNNKSYAFHKCVYIYETIYQRPKTITSYKWSSFIVITKGYVFLKQIISHPGTIL